MSEIDAELADVKTTDVMTGQGHESNGVGIALCSSYIVLTTFSE